MIVCGYPLVGKSTAARYSPRIIDLDCRLFNIRGGLDVDSVDSVNRYCNVADSMSKQGCIVMISSHKYVRDELNRRGIDYSIWLPAPDLKGQWVNEAYMRYKRTDNDKDKRAAEHIASHFDEDVQELLNDAASNDRNVLTVRIADIDHPDYIQAAIKYFEHNLKFETDRKFDFDGDFISRIISTDTTTDLPVITMCGSMKYKGTLKYLAANFALQGYIVHTPAIFDVIDQGLTITPDMHGILDVLHEKKIGMSNLVFVVNCGGYIGPDTQREIDYANSRGIQVKYLEDPDPDKHRIEATRYKK